MYLHGTNNFYGIELSGETGFLPVLFLIAINMRAAQQRACQVERKANESIRYLLKYFCYFHAFLCIFNLYVTRYLSEDYTFT